MYKIEILPQADRDIRVHQKSGNKAAISKIREIFKELIIHPTLGIGKPEQLKYELQGYWSRRIDKKNRIVYRVDEEKHTVVVVSTLGHYL